MSAENTFFAGARAVPQRLQSYAVPVRLGYYRGDEPVAELSLSPGFYFEERFSSKAWDVPVQLVSGVPVSASVHGVVGFANGRFYHHPLPIGGIIWEQNKRWRWECVFPQPAVVFSPDAQSEWRLGGELTGNGYLSDAHPTRTVIEYSCYRVGLEYRSRGARGPQWALGGGVQVENRFDFFRTGRELTGKPTFYLKTSMTFGR